MESRPVVGSSKKIAFGFVISSTPMDVRFLYPPETPFINVFPIFTSLHPTKPNSSKSYSTLSLLWNADNSRRKSAANWKHSLGVRVPSRASSCITYPIWFEYGSTDFTYCPFILYSPSIEMLLDMSLPPRKLRKVVLPEPDGPRMAVKDCAGMTPFCWWRMVLVYFFTLALTVTS